jgi:hypothetical protein
LRIRAERSVWSVFTGKQDGRWIFKEDCCFFLKFWWIFMSLWVLRIWVEIVRMCNNLLEFAIFDEILKEDRCVFWDLGEYLRSLGLRMFKFNKRVSETAKICVFRWNLVIFFLYLMNFWERAVNILDVLRF